MRHTLVFPPPPLNYSTQTGPGGGGGVSKCRRYPSVAMSHKHMATSD